MQIFFKDITSISTNLLMIFKIYRTTLNIKFWHLHPIVWGIQNERETFNKGSEIGPCIFICTFMSPQLHLCPHRRNPGWSAEEAYVTNRFYPVHQYYQNGNIAILQQNPRFLQNDLKLSLFRIGFFGAAHWWGEG